MRDKRFVANHRGGPSSLEKHGLLIYWAVNCVKHGIEIAKEKPIDERTHIPHPFDLKSLFEAAAIISLRITTMIPDVQPHSKTAGSVR